MSHSIALFPSYVITFSEKVWQIQGNSMSKKDRIPNLLMCLRVPLPSFLFKEHFDSE